MFRYSRTRSCSSFSSGYCRSTDSSRSARACVVVPLQRFEAPLVERDRLEIGRAPRRWRRLRRTAGCRRGASSLPSSRGRATVRLASCGWDFGWPPLLRHETAAREKSRRKRAKVPERLVAGQATASARLADRVKIGHSTRFLGSLDCRVDLVGASSRCLRASALMACRLVRPPFLVITPNSAAISVVAAGGSSVYILSL